MAKSKNTSGALYEHMNNLKVHAPEGPRGPTCLQDIKILTHEDGNLKPMRRLATKSQLLNRLACHTLVQIGPQPYDQSC